jgi:hypothetical protein
LVFEKGEIYINKADAIYSAISTTNSAYAKFLIKKSSFMKKYGFFDVAVGILQDLEKTLLTMMVKGIERESAKKLLFKVFRDQARIYALKRKEDLANSFHSKAEK